MKNNRLYLDHNATTPVSLKLKDQLCDYWRNTEIFSNPASIHTSGKQARLELEKIRQNILIDLGFIGPKAMELIFHSGASEGIAMVIKGHALGLYAKKQKGHYFFSPTDHSCVLAHADFLKLLGHDVHFFSVNREGELSEDEAIKLIKSCEGPSFVNFTTVNNETGVHWPISLALALAKKTEAFIHVDAAQLPFKVKNWHELSSELHAYTFSGHKFGALKGSGMTFLRPDCVKALQEWPIVAGGGQQKGLRSGTENTLTALSLMWALEEGKETADILKVINERLIFEDHLKKHFGDCLIIAGEKASFRASNTVNFIIKGVKAQKLLTLFDLRGLDVSAGSACSSGLFRPSPVLKAMHYSEEEASSSLRISFSPFFQKETFSKAIFEIQKIKL